MKISEKMMNYAIILGGVAGMLTGMYIVSSDNKKDNTASKEYVQSAQEYRDAERERFARDVFQVLSNGEDQHDLAKIIKKKFDSKVYTGNNKEHLGRLLYHLDMIKEIYPESIKGNMYVVCAEDEDEKKEKR